jgi:di/tricarboxylate transporter
VAVSVLGVISPAEALAGFANEAVITVGALFVVAAGLRSTGVLDQVGNWLLGTARTTGAAAVRLALALEAISAVILNTAVVAMFVPVVLDWCRRRGVSPSRLLIPVSYLAILGGTCTLIGTSTTIIVNGLLNQEHRLEEQRIAEGQGRYPADPQASRAFSHELRGMTLWEIGQVGLPCALVGGLYLLLFGRRVLPDRRELVEQLDEQRREYLVETLVQPECRLIGKTVEEAGLRHLRGLFLVEIDREGDSITPVTPGDRILAGDRLIFTGVVSTIVDLEKIPGLVPAADTTYDFHPRAR